MMESGDLATRELRLLGNPSELRRVRSHVDYEAARFGLGPADRYQLVVAVNEAVTNAIRHGRPRIDGTIGVRIAVDGNALVCSVTDRGQLKPADSSADPLAEGGRGLTLMALLTDEVEFSSDAQGTTVRLHKRRSGSRLESH